MTARCYSRRYALAAGGAAARIGIPRREDRLFFGDSRAGRHSTSDASPLTRLSITEIELTPFSIRRGCCAKA
jgi:hypothetical protein